LVSAVGAVDVLAMEYHPSNIPSCSPTACAVRTLAGADNPSASLAFDMEMTVDSLTGEVTNGAMTVVPAQSVVLGSLANFTAVELEFLEFSLNFSASGAGALSGVIEDGLLNLINRSSIPGVDIQEYNLVFGPAVIPITGTLDITSVSR
jgi:hypothetical protein